MCNCNKIIKTSCCCCCNCYVNECITVCPQIIKIYPRIVRLPIKQYSTNKCNLLKNPDGSWNTVYDKLKYIMYTDKR